MEDNKKDKKKDNASVDTKNLKKIVQDTVAKNVDDKQLISNLPEKSVGDKQPVSNLPEKSVGDKQPVSSPPEIKNTINTNSSSSNTASTQAYVGKKFKKNYRDKPPRFSGGNKSSKQKGGQRRGGDNKFERPKQEFEQKIIDIRRVVRVMAGGRRFSFSVAVVVGNRKGKVGVGVGKASDTTLAIEKAFKNAEKNMVIFKLNNKSSIPHEARACYCTSEILVKPAEGKGIVAGSSARTVLDFAGVTDVSLKIFSRSKNKINIARATILALNEFKI